MSTADELVAHERVRSRDRFSSRRHARVGSASNTAKDEQDQIASTSPGTSPPLSNSNTQSLSTQEGLLQVLCNSTDTQVGAITVQSAGRDINLGISAAELERIQAAIWAEARATLLAIPSNMGFSNANGLVLTDALGETITLPWSLVPTYDDLGKLLVRHFQHKVGERRVLEGRYCIARAEGVHGGEVVSRENWEGVVGGPERLVMSMLFERLRHWWEWYKKYERVCPKCGKTKLGTYEDQGWYICRGCYTRFATPGEIKYREDIDLEDKDNEEAYFRHVRKMEMKNLVPLRKLLALVSLPASFA